MNVEIEKYLLGRMSKEERMDFLRKLAFDKELMAEFGRHRNLEALLALSGSVDNSSDDVKRSYHCLMRRVRRRTLYKYTLRISGYAAAVASLILSVYFYHHSYLRNQPPPVSETSLFVPAGQRVSLTLSDGTTVWLNARSRLTYPTAFIGDQRHVSIEGEAWFEVAEDKKKPFIVSANGTKIRVLGTTFNVNSYAEENVTCISLVEGSLQVYDACSPEVKTTLLPNQEAIIRNHAITTGEIQNSDYFLWKDGIYSFENEMLTNICKKLELYYDIKIEVANPTILNWRYTVKFRQRDGIDEILRLLRRVYPLKIQKFEEENKVIINK